MKKLTAVLALLLACVLLLVACDGAGGMTQEEKEAEALKIGQELYDEAAAFTKRDKFTFVYYENSSTEKRYEHNGNFYNEITNFYELLGDTFSDDAVIALKRQMGLLLSSDAASGKSLAFVRMYEDESLYSHTTLELTEMTNTRYTFAATAFYFENEDAATATRTEVTSFIVAKGYVIVTQDGEEVKQPLWQIIEFTEPWHYAFAVVDGE